MVPTAAVCGYICGFIAPVCATVSKTPAARSATGQKGIYSGYLIYYKCGSSEAKGTWHANSEVLHYILRRIFVLSLQCLKQVYTRFHHLTEGTKHDIAL